MADLEKMATVDLEDMNLQLKNLLEQIRTSDPYNSARVAQTIALLTKEIQGQYKRLAYRIRVPSKDFVENYSPDLDGLRKSREHYIKVKNIGGKWFEVQRGFDGIERENPMPEEYM